MTLADAWPAQKPLYLRTYLYGEHRDRRHQFVGSLMVPKRLSDGRYPLVDVWTIAMDEVVITPFEENPAKFPKLYFGAAELNHPANVVGHQALHIDTARGVEPSGYGFGYILYVASALAAKFAGPAGVYSMEATRSVDASELWARMKKISFGWVRGPLGRHTQWKYDSIDYILGADVLDSGLVTRVGMKYGRQWASFRKPPTDNFAYDLKYKAKKLSAWERSAIAMDGRHHTNA